MLYFQHEPRIKSLILEIDYRHYILEFSVLAKIETLCFFYIYSGSVYYVAVNL